MGQRNTPPQTPDSKKEAATAGPTDQDMDALQAALDAEAEAMAQELAQSSSAASTAPAPEQPKTPSPSSAGSSATATSSSDSASSSRHSPSTESYSPGSSLGSSSLRSLGTGGSLGSGSLGSLSTPRADRADRKTTPRTPKALPDIKADTNTQLRALVGNTYQDSVDKLRSLFNESTRRINNLKKQWEELKTTAAYSDFKESGSAERRLTIDDLKKPQAPTAAEYREQEVYSKKLTEYKRNVANYEERNIPYIEKVFYSASLKYLEKKNPDAWKQIKSLLPQERRNQLYEHTLGKITLGDIVEEHRAQMVRAHIKPYLKNYLQVEEKLLNDYEQVTAQAQEIYKLYYHPIDNLRKSLYELVLGEADRQLAVIYAYMTNVLKTGRLDQRDYNNKVLALVEQFNERFTGFAKIELSEKFNLSKGTLTAKRVHATTPITVGDLKLAKTEEERTKYDAMPAMQAVTSLIKAIEETYTKSKNHSPAESKLDLHSGLYILLQKIQNDYPQLISEILPHSDDHPQLFAIAGFKEAARKIQEYEAAFAAVIKKISTYNNQTALMRDNAFAGRDPVSGRNTGSLSEKMQNDLDELQEFMKKTSARRAKILDRYKKFRGKIHFNKVKSAANRPQYVAAQAERDKAYAAIFHSLQSVAEFTPARTVPAALEAIKRAVEIPGRGNEARERGVARLNSQNHFYALAHAASLPVSDVKAASSAPSTSTGLAQHALKTTLLRDQLKTVIIDQLRQLREEGLRRAMSIPYPEEVEQKAKTAATTISLETKAAETKSVADRADEKSSVAPSASPLTASDNLTASQIKYLEDNYTTFGSAERASIAIYLALRNIDLDKRDQEERVDVDISTAARELQKRLDPIKGNPIEFLRTMLSENLTNQWQTHYDEWKALNQENHASRLKELKSLERKLESLAHSDAFNKSQLFSAQKATNLRDYLQAEAKLIGSQIESYRRLGGSDKILALYDKHLQLPAIKKELANLLKEAIAQYHAGLKLNKAESNGEFHVFALRKAKFNVAFQIDDQGREYFAKADTKGQLVINDDLINRLNEKQLASALNMFFSGLTINTQMFTSAAKEHYERIPAKKDPTEIENFNSYWRGIAEINKKGELLLFDPQVIGKNLEKTQGTSLRVLEEILTPQKIAERVDRYRRQILQHVLEYERNRTSQQANADQEKVHSELEKRLRSDKFQTITYIKNLARDRHQRQFLRNPTVLEKEKFNHLFHGIAHINAENKLDFTSSEQMAKMTACIAGIASYLVRSSSVFASFKSPTVIGVVA